MFTITQSVPATENDAIYTDDPIVITFNKEADPTFFTTDTVIVWRVSADKEQFIDRAMVELTFNTGATVLSISPGVGFRPVSVYMIKIMETVSAADGETLGTPYITYVHTSSGVRPSPVSTDPDVTIPASGGTDFGSQSTDLFSTSGPTSQISLLRSTPGNFTVGSRDFDRIILLYNDEINSDYTIPADAVTLRCIDLPVDSDPFSNNTIGVLSITPNGHQLVIQLDEIVDAINREFIVTIAGGYVYGVNRQAPDLEEHTLRFMGPLTPVYSTPEQVKRHLYAITSSEATTVTDYNIWQAILEASVFVRDNMHAVLTAETASSINRLVVCLVLRDYLLHAIIGRGEIKSRDLLQTKVEFFQTDIGTIKDSLDECIDNNLAGAGIPRTLIFNGIRSEQWLTPATKRYRTSHR